MIKLSNELTAIKERAGVDLVEIIKSSWLNTNARADLLKLGKPIGELEKINIEQCKSLAQAISQEVIGA